MKRSEYRKTTFNLPSNRHLWKTLGEFDALMQYLECACISFDKKQKDSGLSFNDFLKSQSDFMTHPITSLAFDNPIEEIHNIYLVYPHTCLDVFVGNCIADIKCLRIPKYEPVHTNGVSKLENLITSIKRIGAKPDFEDFSLPIYNYYRYIRNCINHADYTKDKKVKDSYNKVEPLREEIHKRFKNGESLKECGALNFDDYILCTANIKNICDKIAISVESIIDWNNFFVENDKNMVNQLKIYKNEKRISHMRHYIQTMYGVAPSDKHLLHIAEETISHFSGQRID